MTFRYVEINKHKYHKLTYNFAALMLICFEEQCSIFLTQQIIEYVIHVNDTFKLSDL